MKRSFFKKAVEQNDKPENATPKANGHTSSHDQEDQSHDQHSALSHEDSPMSPERPDTPNVVEGGLEDADCAEKLTSAQKLASFAFKSA